MTVANETTTDLKAPLHRGAVLDDAHIGHIHELWERSVTATPRHASGSAHGGKPSSRSLVRDSS
jgi:hypothetical protein